MDIFSFFYVSVEQVNMCYLRPLMYIQDTSWDLSCVKFFARNFTHNQLHLDWKFLETEKTSVGIHWGRESRNNSSLNASAKTVFEIFRSTSVWNEPSSREADIGRRCDLFAGESRRTSTMGVDTAKGSKDGSSVRALSELENSWRRSRFWDIPSRNTCNVHPYPE